MNVKWPIKFYTVILSLHDYERAHHLEEKITILKVGLRTRHALNLTSMEIKGDLVKNIYIGPSWAYF